MNTIIHLIKTLTKPVIPAEAGIQSSIPDPGLRRGDAGVVLAVGRTPHQARCDWGVVRSDEERLTL